MKLTTARAKSIATVEPLETRTLFSALPTGAPALHLLFYGASYVNGYQPGKGDVQGLPGILSQLAVAAGYQAPIISNQSTDNQTLAYALAHFNASKVSASTDYVIFQDQSYVMSNGKGVGDVHDSERNALAIYQKVKAIAPNAIPVIFEDWGRSAKDTSELKQWYPNLTASAAATQMQTDIKNNTTIEAVYVNKVAGSGKTKIAHVGDAFAKDKLSQDLFASDNHHGSNEAYMMSGLVFFDTLYGATSTGKNFASVFSSHGITTAVGATIEKLADEVS